MYEERDCDEEYCAKVTGDIFGVSQGENISPSTFIEFSFDCRNSARMW